jgi:hypothetical protein
MTIKHLKIIVSLGLIAVFAQACALMEAPEPQTPVPQSYPDIGKLKDEVSPGGAVLTPAERQQAIDSLSRRKG